MSDRINMADPEFEPTDEQLMQLSREAFAHVRARHEESLRELRARIAAGRRDALLRIRRPAP